LSPVSSYHRSDFITPVRLMQEKSGNNFEKQRFFRREGAVFAACS
jgi:hypothetical protein